MPMDSLTPDPQRLLNLRDAIHTILVALPYVARLYHFGSLMRGDWDCWSDIDVLVVTQTRRQFRMAYNALCEQKQIIHRSPFVPQVEPAGGYVLGNVFAGESVFHCLDLNFLTLAEHDSPVAFTRFGELTQVYHSDVPIIEDTGDLLPAEAETLDEAHINYGIHFTKKAVKRMLRSQSAQDDLQKFAAVLRTTMRDYPADYATPTGAIGQVAWAYLTIAGKLLKM